MKISSSRFSSQFNFARAQPRSEKAVRSRVPFYRRISPSSTWSACLKSALRLFRKSLIEFRRERKITLGIRQNIGIVAKIMHPSGG